jgi:hypothetical protein
MCGLYVACRILCSLCTEHMNVHWLAYVHMLTDFFIKFHTEGYIMKIYGGKFNFCL